MSKKRRAGKTNIRPKNNPWRAHQFSYGITDEPLEDADFERLPKSARDTSERLYHMLETRPDEAIPELLKLIEEYPNIPMWYNYLCSAYSFAGDEIKSREVALMNYQRNPEYLFARINYAEICLAERDYDKIAEIFDHKSDLGLLYPERKCFHVSEFAGFMGVLGAYYFLTGRRQIAKILYEDLNDVVPDSPMTLRLGRILNPGSLQQILSRLAGRP
jgi:tetratricopeptide (TPR) repeat protein